MEQNPVLAGALSDGAPRAGLVVTPFDLAQRVQRRAFVGVVGHARTCAACSHTRRCSSLRDSHAGKSNTSGAAPTHRS